MSISLYLFLHVSAAILMVAITFSACAAPAEENKRCHQMFGGLASLITLVAGFGLLAKTGQGFPVWIIIKLVCWFGIAALSGLAHRNPAGTRKYGLIATALVLLAIYCVVFKPF
ncbi:MAG: hypothetical protein QF724_10670 [Planctomycetota bacterium]|jgi:hypothetical protein|nr:hypothetical protein [Planctomycetota bacterium]MDP6368508.1 hypothetical protein [Planctomycetota bacterium]MDP6520717.1 hypothetical protein [Planctomycetota bacterium]MDP6839390.1 hypothetical protein [Planctomycetota bacterium]MDP6955715.1 hypothetical protein [Planctomycetota bacterium]